MGTVKDIYDIIMELVKGDIADREKIFNNHIEPLHQKFIEIHRDYMAGFADIAERLEKMTVPTTDIIEFLKQRKREYEHERLIVTAIAKKLKESKHTDKYGEIGDTLVAYCESIIQYFISSTGVAGYTWYTDFISMVEARSRITNNGITIWNPMAIDGNPRTTLLNEVNDVLTTKLPASFEKAINLYAKLKTDLL